MAKVFVYTSPPALQDVNQGISTDGAGPLLSVSPAEKDHETAAGRDGHHIPWGRSKVEGHSGTGLYSRSWFPEHPQTPAQCP